MRTGASQGNEIGKKGAVVFHMLKDIHEQIESRAGSHVTKIIGHAAMAKTALRIDSLGGFYGHLRIVNAKTVILPTKGGDGPPCAAAHINNKIIPLVRHGLTDKGKKDAAARRKPPVPGFNLGMYAEHFRLHELFLALPYPSR
jgi:hypothetical protein